VLLEAFSSSMVSYLKLFLEFLTLRRRLVSATLNNQLACKPIMHVRHPDARALSKLNSLLEGEDEW